MNGWGKAEPAWWLNLQANPDAEVVLPDGSHAVRARAAIGEERERLWATFQDFPGWGDDLDGLAARRPGQTAIVVLEPRASGVGRPAVSVVASAASATTAAESDVEVESAVSSSSSFRSFVAASKAAPAPRSVASRSAARAIARASRPGWFRSKSAYTAALTSSVRLGANS